MRKWVWITIVLLVFMVGGYAVAAKAWGLPEVPWAETTRNKKGVTQTCSCSLGQFITNLKDSGRFIRVSVDLQVVDDECQEELITRGSEIKTDIYGLLRSKTYDEMLGEKGLRELQADILSRIEMTCPGTVVKVFFTEFLVQ